MGSTVDKFMNFMKLDNKDEEDYDDDFGYDDDDTEESSKPAIADNSDKSKKASKGPFKGQEKDRRKNNMVSNVNSGVCMRNPKKLDDASEVVDDLRAGNSVVLNLDGLDPTMANDIYSFLCGASYALDCSLEKVSETVFVITPKNVPLSGDFLASDVGARMY